jgi:hypothetical protein
VRSWTRRLLCARIRTTADVGAWGCLSTFCRGTGDTANRSHAGYTTATVTVCPSVLGNHRQCARGDRTASRRLLADVIRPHRQRKRRPPRGVSAASRSC